MNKNRKPEQKMNKRLRFRTQYKRWQKVVSVLAAITVFTTTYALILPAITIETSVDPVFTEAEEAVLGYGGQELPGEFTGEPEKDLLAAAVSQLMPEGDELPAEVRAETEKARSAFEPDEDGAFIRWAWTQTGLSEVADAVTKKKGGEENTGDGETPTGPEGVALWKANLEENKQYLGWGSHVPKTGDLVILKLPPEKSGAEADTKAGEATGTGSTSEEQQNEENPEPQRYAAAVVRSLTGGEIREAADPAEWEMALENYRDYRNKQEAAAGEESSEEIPAPAYIPVSVKTGSEGDAKEASDAPQTLNYLIPSDTVMNVIAGDAKGHVLSFEYPITDTSIDGFIDVKAVKDAIQKEKEAAAQAEPATVESAPGSDDAKTTEAEPAAEEKTAAPEEEKLSEETQANAPEAAESTSEPDEKIDEILPDAGEEEIQLGEAKVLSGSDVTPYSISGVTSNILRAAPLRATGRSVDVDKWRLLPLIIGEAPQSGGNVTAVLTEHLVASDPITIPSGVNLTLISSGGERKIYRKSGATNFSVFKVEEGGTLTLGNGVTMTGETAEEDWTDGTSGTPTAVYTRTESNWAKTTAITAADVQGKTFTFSIGKRNDETGTDGNFLNTRPVLFASWTSEAMIVSPSVINSSYSWDRARWEVRDVKTDENGKVWFRLFNPVLNGVFNGTGYYLAAGGIETGVARYTAMLTANQLEDAGDRAYFTLEYDKILTDYNKNPIGTGMWLKNKKVYDDSSSSRGGNLSIKEVSSNNFKPVFYPNAGKPLYIIERGYMTYTTGGTPPRFNGIKNVKMPIYLRNTNNAVTGTKGHMNYSGYTFETFDSGRYEDGAFVPVETDAQGVDISKGFFVQVEKGGTFNMQSGARMTNFHAGQVEAAFNSPAWTAPVVVNGGTLNMEGGSIDDNIVGYTASDLKSGMQAQGGTGGGTENYLKSGVRFTNTAGGIILKNGANGSISGFAAISRNRGDVGGVLVTGEGTTLAIGGKLTPIKDGEGKITGYTRTATNGGLIDKNTGFHHAGGLQVERGAYATMLGADSAICDNVTWSKGGGVWATEFGTKNYAQINYRKKVLSNESDRGKEPTFVMRSGFIDRNTAFLRGGGINVESDQVILLGGSISNNNSRVLGGGIYVEGDYPSYSFTLKLDKGYIGENYSVRYWNLNNDPVTQGDSHRLAGKSLTELNNILDRMLSGADSEGNPIHNGSTLSPNNNGNRTADPVAFPRPHEGAGGGIWLCPIGGTASIALGNNNEVIIDDNYASGRSDGDALYKGTDFYLHSGTGHMVISGLNGESWVVEGSNPKRYVPDNGPVYSGPLYLVNETENNAVINTNPNTTTYLEHKVNAKLTLQIRHNLSRDGGGIAADGTLLLGEAQSQWTHDAEMKVKKSWSSMLNRTPVSFRVGYRNDNDEYIWLPGYDFSMNGQMDGTEVYHPSPEVEEWTSKITIPDTYEKTYVDNGVTKVRPAPTYKFTITDAGGQIHTIDPSDSTSMADFGMILKGLKDANKLDADDSVTLNIVTGSWRIVIEELDSSGTPTGRFVSSPTSLKAALVQSEDHEIRQDGGLGEVLANYTIGFTSAAFEGKIDNDYEEQMVEKYINNVVHQDLTDFEEVVEYSVMAYVPMNATQITIKDKLEKGLMFVDSNGDPQFSDVDDELAGTVNSDFNARGAWGLISKDGQDLVCVETNDHIGDGTGTVASRGAGNKIEAPFDQTQIPSGQDENMAYKANHIRIVSEANDTVSFNSAGDTIWVMLDENTGIRDVRGKWVILTFKAALKPSYRDVDKLKKAGWATEAESKQGSPLAPGYIEDIRAALAKQGRSMTLIRESDNKILVKDSAGDVYQYMKRAAAVDGRFVPSGTDPETYLFRWYRLGLHNNASTSFTPLGDGGQWDTSSKAINIGTDGLNSTRGILDAPSAPTDYRDVTFGYNWPVMEAQEPHSGVKNQADYNVRFPNGNTADYKTNVVTLDVILPEKYINNKVHHVLGSGEQEAGSFDEPFEYSIMGYVPEGATEIILMDTLREDLMFVDSRGNPQFQQFVVGRQEDGIGTGSNTDLLNASFGFKVNDNGQITQKQTVIDNNSATTSKYQLVWIAENDHIGDGTGKVSLHQGVTDSAQHINYPINNPSSYPMNGSDANIIVGDLQPDGTVTPNPAGRTLWVRIEKVKWNVGIEALWGKWVILSYRAQIKPSRYDDIQKKLMKEEDHAKTPGNSYYAEQLKEALGGEPVVSRVLENDNYVLIRANDENYVLRKSGANSGKWLKVVNSGGRRAYDLAGNLVIDGNLNQDGRLGLSWEQINGDLTGSGQTAQVYYTYGKDPAYQELTTAIGSEPDHYLAGEHFLLAAKGNDVYQYPRTVQGLDKIPAGKTGDQLLDKWYKLSLEGGSTGFQPVGSSEKYTDMTHLGLHATWGMFSMNNRTPVGGAYGTLSDYSNSPFNTYEICKRILSNENNNYVFAYTPAGWNNTEGSSWEKVRSDGTVLQGTDVEADGSHAGLANQAVYKIKKDGSYRTANTNTVTVIPQLKDISVAKKWAVDENHSLPDAETLKNSLHLWWEREVDGQAKVMGEITDLYKDHLEVTVDNTYDGKRYIWAIEWKNLPKLRPSMKYFVTEDPIPGFDVPQFANTDSVTREHAHDGGEIINIQQEQPEYTHISVDKTWNVGTAADSERVRADKSVQVRLYQGDTPVGDAQTLDDSNSPSSWGYTWRNLPLYKQGTNGEIVFTAENSTAQDGTHVKGDNGSYYRVFPDYVKRTGDYEDRDGVRFWKGTDGVYYSARRNMPAGVVREGSSWYKPERLAYEVRVVQDPAGFHRTTEAQTVVNYRTTEYTAVMTESYDYHAQDNPSPAPVGYLTKDGSDGFTVFSSTLPAGTEGTDFVKAYAKSREAYVAYEYDVVNALPQIEKYVNNDVHDKIFLQEEFDYSILAYVPGEAEEIKISDKLVESLELVSFDSISLGASRQIIQGENPITPAQAAAATGAEITMAVHATNNHTVNGTVASRDAAETAKGTVKWNGTDRTFTVDIKNIEFWGAPSYVADAAGSFRIGSDGKFYKDGATLPEGVTLQDQKYKMAEMTMVLPGETAQSTDYKKGSDGHFYPRNAVLPTGVTRADMELYRATDIGTNKQLIGGRFVELNLKVRINPNYYNLVKAHIGSTNPGSRVNSAISWDIIHSDSNEKNYGVPLSRSSNAPGEIINKTGIGDGIIQGVTESPHAGIVNTASYKVKFKGEQDFTDDFKSNTVTVWPVVDNLTFGKTDVEGKPIDHDTTESTATFVLMDRTSADSPSRPPTSTQGRTVRYVSVPMTGDNNLYSFVDADASGEPKNGATIENTGLAPGNYWLLETRAPDLYEGGPAVAVTLSYDEGNKLVLTWPYGVPESGKSGGVILPEIPISELQQEENAMLAATGKTTYRATFGVNRFDEYYRYAPLGNNASLLLEEDTPSTNTFTSYARFLHGNENGIDGHLAWDIREYQGTSLEEKSGFTNLMDRDLGISLQDKQNVNDLSVEDYENFQTQLKAILYYGYGGPGYTPSPNVNHQMDQMAYLITQAAIWLTTCPEYCEKPCQESPYGLTNFQRYLYTLCPFAERRIDRWNIGDIQDLSEEIRTQANNLRSRSLQGISAEELILLGMKQVFTPTSGGIPSTGSNPYEMNMISIRQNTLSEEDFTVQNQPQRIPLEMQKTDVLGNPVGYGRKYDVIQTDWGGGKKGLYVYKPEKEPNAYFWAGYWESPDSTDTMATYQVINGQYFITSPGLYTIAGETRRSNIVNQNFGVWYDYKAADAVELKKNLSTFYLVKENKTVPFTKETVAEWLEKKDTETPEDWRDRLRKHGDYVSIPYQQGATLGQYKFYRVGTDPDSVDPELTRLEPGLYWLVETDIPPDYDQRVPPVRLNIQVDPDDHTKAKVSYSPVENTDKEAEAYEYFIGRTNLNTRTGDQNYDFRFKNHYLYTMPETGGLGAEHFTAGGIAMILGLLTWWILRRRFEGIDLPVPAAPAAILSTAKDHKPIYYDRFVNIRTGHLMYKKYRRKEVIQRE